MKQLVNDSTLFFSIRWAVLWSVAVLLGVAVLLVDSVPDLSSPFIGIGAGICMLLVLTAASTVHMQQSLRDQRILLKNLAVPLQLTPDSDLFACYRLFTEALAGLADTADPLQREFALSKLDSLCEEIEELAQGQIVFHGTETWRAAYGDLLSSLTVKSYFSVSWVRSGDYWNDPPGRHSMRLNYELLKRGFRIERILILADELWPFEEAHPTPEIRPWIDEQLLRGVSVRLVRESDLADERDLLADFGIYGDRAVGVQELDEHSRTVRFLLQFDERSRQQAHDRWRRLQLFATPCSSLLDRTTAHR